MKKTKKQLQEEKLKAIEWKMFRVLQGFDLDDLMSFITSDIRKYVEGLQKDIKSEQEWVNWETGGAYHSAAQEGKKNIKSLQKEVKECKEIIKQVEAAFKKIKKVKGLDG